MNKYWRARSEQYIDRYTYVTFLDVFFFSFSLYLYNILTGFVDNIILFWIPGTRWLTSPTAFERMFTQSKHCGIKLKIVTIFNQSIAFIGVGGAQRLTQWKTAQVTVTTCTYNVTEIHWRSFSGIKSYIGNALHTITTFSGRSIIW